MTTFESKAGEFRARAAEERRRADSTDLPRQRAAFIRCAEVWEEMARKADAIEEHVHRNVQAIAANAAIKERRLKG